MPGRSCSLGEPSPGTGAIGDAASPDERTPPGRIHRTSTPNRSSTSNGLTTWSFMPASSDRARSAAVAFAVMATIGSAAHAGLARIRRVAVYPSITGI